MNKNIKIYRLKHKATGLYYKPGSKNNLSESGKIYTTPQNLLTIIGNNNCEILYVINKKLLKKYKDKFESCGFINCKDSNGDITMWSQYCKKEDFEKETLTILGNE